ncbi:hypothetical protein O6H91_11G038900 [Diphasiastrum complanatum]|uniref:Uncharacterized protein n=2 Tax=Diphasiastrum complanatum TaxID=34168 RepID=A0ACC2C8M8_DIPCM|nr:hypothetical protein O6H91_11G038700 [Diphasiastrum complanatum]KAJ7538224.1 hypothetical protein O6H91_11G038900 [Diphasiastrum complanatum]
MAFAGTQQKCKACDKTVYLVDQLVADNVVYHKACFRCHHCKGTLKLSNYASLEGVLYCKPHFDQLFKLTGSFDKSFDTGLTSKHVTKSHEHETSKAPSKVSSLFSGTQEKCVVCEKTVYPIEKVSVESHSYHKHCFKCAHGGCVISPSNYQAHEGRLYCRHHYTQLFKEKGNFSNLTKIPPPVKSGSKAEV